MLRAGVSSAFPLRYTGLRGPSQLQRPAKTFEAASFSARSRSINGLYRPHLHMHEVLQLSVKWQPNQSDALAIDESSAGHTVGTLKGQTHLHQLPGSASSGTPAHPAAH